MGRRVRRARVAVPKARNIKVPVKGRGNSSLEAKFALGKRKKVDERKTNATGVPGSRRQGTV